MKTAICHPEEAHEAKGLCKKCYHITYRRDNKEKRKEAYRKWKRDNPEKARAQWKRRDYASGYHRFGLTVAQYRELAEHFGKICPICHKEPSGKKKRLCVDHDHKTGKIRGMLCDDCNVSLGKFDDNAAALRRAADYLEGKLFAA